jgi:arginine deiminase
LAVQVMKYKFEDPHDQHHQDHDEEEIQRSFPVGHGTTISSEAREYFLSDEYKRKCISAMGVQDIIDLILCSPTVQLRPSSTNTPIRIKRINTRPTLNLTFTRDQQLVTYKGLVLNRMGSPQRLNETKIMEHVFKVLGIEVLGAIREPGMAEGGDFYPMGPDLSMIGVGLRTNQYAVDTMMKNDWFGTRRVAVVRDCFDMNQQRMHLDTIFNVCGDNVCTLLDSVIGDSKIRRLVTEYTQDATGKYQVTQKDIEFSNYLKKEGYHVIPVTNTQQEAYGLNYLNLKYTI